MRDLTDALGLPQMWNWKLVVWHKDFEKTHRGMDMLGVRYYLDKPGQGASLPGTKILGTSDLDVVESPTAWPSAFFTDAAFSYHNLAEIRYLVDKGDGRPFAVMLPKDFAKLPLPKRDLAARVVVPATHYRLTQNSTAFDVDAPSPGLVVLGEAWQPGDIEVAVDGKPAEMLRVNHAFRGVYLSQAGTHRVTFRYRPEALDLALGIAGVGLAASVFALWWLLRRKPVTPPRNGTLPAKPTLEECLTTP
jgi:hypothetical protein